MNSAISILAFLISVSALADIAVTTNSQNVKGDLYSGKISRVVFYDTDDVGVFMNSSATDAGAAIGVSFTGKDAFIGAAVAGSVGKIATLSRQKDRHYTFSVDN